MTWRWGSGRLNSSRVGIWNLESPMFLKSKHPGRGQPDRKGHVHTASLGMVWVSTAVAVAKALSFVSQILLGYLLSVETYAVFGLAAATLALVAGFQNSSISKVLIQKGDDFERFFEDYSALAFQFGLIGAVILCILGFGMQFYYGIPELFPVLVITAISVPILAANTILIADLSRSFRFKDINKAEILNSFVYTSILVSAAWLGANVFTVAIATVLAAVIAYVYLRKFAADRPAYFYIRPRKFWDLLGSIRSAILAGFLVALAMRADYLVLGRLLAAEALGFYTFGFMLVASLMQPISTGINQVFLPIFAKLQKNHAGLALSLDRCTLVIAMLASIFCLGLIGLAPWLIHLAWEGKWDDSQIVIVALLFAMPFRFVATIAGVAFEATGAWRLRNKLLALQAFLLATFAGIGAIYGGLIGAILGVIIQRILSGLIDFAAVKYFLGASTFPTVSFLLRSLAPFLVGCAVLLVQLGSIERLNVTSVAELMLSTTAAVTVTGALILALNPSLWRDIRALGKNIAKRLIKRFRIDPLG
jgi:O-antigen/teichoic acid export membrane protein